jgi:EAL domain-containing protein (putative c-di-GMP-specific phosphodiesterase class I)/CHASE1-domain containing sensor protein
LLGRSGKAVAEIRLPLSAVQLEWLRNAAIGLIVAASSYFCLAKIGLVLALPVGYASLLWPATGAAVLTVLRRGISGIAGIAIGASLAYLVSAPETASPQDAWPGLFALAVVGVAAALQAAISAQLLRHHAQTSADEILHPLKLILIAAWLMPASMLRAIVATLVLFQAGLVRDFSPWTFGLTMVLGDVLGTLSALPFILMTGVSTWSWLRIRDTLRSILSIMLSLLVLGWLVAAVMFELRLSKDRTDFQVQSRALIREMAAQPDEDALLLKAMRSLSNANPELSFAQFCDFASIVLQARPQIDNMALIRRVAPADRAAFEAARTSESGQPFHISELGPDKHLQPEPERQRDYYALDYVEPRDRARIARGFDLASEPRRTAALHQAAATGLATATAGIELPGQAGKGLAVVVVFPLASSSGKPDLDSIRGYVDLTIKIDRWIGALLPQSGGLMQTASISIDDVSDGTAQSLIRVAAAKPLSTTPPAAAPGFVEQTELDMEGRRWRVTVGMPPRHLGYLRDPVAWVSLILPQLLAVLLTGTLLLALNQGRARDRLELQVSALSRRYLNDLGTAPLPVASNPPLLLNALDADCEAVWAEDRIDQYYQPVVDLRNGQLLGFESLLRIRAGGPAPQTYDFILWAERNGHIKTLTRRAIAAALEQIERFQAAAKRLEVPWISVNVSASDLGDDGFTDGVIALVQNHPLSRTRLKLELTESVLLADLALAAERLRLLRSAGLRIALDDFGTGYASLSYLHQLPLDTLKIDRSFICRVGPDVTAREIVLAMIAMARKLGLGVIAEGIEDTATAQAVLRLGCTQGQGYRFSKAEPADTVTDWVRTRQRFVAN